MSAAPFIQKTYELCCDPSHAGICGWGENYDSIAILDIDEFARAVLPKYFKHCKYSSFTRQLYKYDFHKTDNQRVQGEFKHPYFLKDQPEMMVFIQRKTTGSASEVKSSVETCETAQYTTESGVLICDEEKLTVLEKRQAHLIAESDEMKHLIHETVHENNRMIHTMDMILNSALSSVELAQKGLPLNMRAFTEDVEASSPQGKSKMFTPFKKLMKIFQKT